MFEFCAAITIVGLLLLIIAMICLATEVDPFGLWITLTIVACVMMVCGSAFGIGLYEPNQNELSSSHEEHIEDNEYSYCPYCGKEIK